MKDRIRCAGYLLGEGKERVPKKACGEPLDGERRGGKKEDLLKSVSDYRAILKVLVRPMGSLHSKVAC